MAYRELHVVEVKEVLRLWSREPCFDPTASAPFASTTSSSNWA